MAQTWSESNPIFDEPADMCVCVAKVKFPRDDDDRFHHSRSSLEGRDENRQDDSLRGGNK